MGPTDAASRIALPLTSRGGKPLPGASNGPPSHCDTYSATAESQLRARQVITSAVGLQREGQKDVVEARVDGDAVPSARSGSVGAVAPAPVPSVPALAGLTDRLT